jgi:DNA-binding response OmpR family regulator
MARVLLVEDDNTLGMTLEMTLSGHGHALSWCRTIASARDSIADSTPDLVILDLGLPDGDGIELCDELRKSGCIAPILMLTARGTLESRLDGLRVGADDYVAKPFELPELLARIDALLRRQQWYRPSDQLSVGQLSVDFHHYRAEVAGEAIAMTDLEFRLLRHLLNAGGAPVSRAELLTEVWKLSAETQTRTVDVFVSRLRRHIETNSSNPRHLLNVRGVGYRLLMEPQEETV